MAATLSFETQVALNDVVYLSAFCGGAWNLDRVAGKCKPGEKFPIKVFQVMITQLLISLVFMLGQLWFTLFVTELQALSWLAFVVYHAVVGLRTYLRDRTAYSKRMEEARQERLAAEAPPPPQG